MFKYTQTFKQQVVDFYFKNHESVPLTSHTFNVPKRTLRHWIAVFQHSGEKGLAPSHPNQRYSLEFKLKVIQTILRGEMTTELAYLHFGIPDASIIRRWLKIYQQSGIEGLQPKHPGIPAMKKPRYAKMPPPPKTEEERLRLRILELETENAYLKKCQELDRKKMRKKPTSSKN